MKLLLLHGVNLNMLGRRDEKIYGTFTLAELEKQVKDYAAKFGVKVTAKQTNSESKLVEILQRTKADAVLLNAGAYTHYSYALRDAVECIRPPVVEVHISDITNREAFRKTDVFDGVVAARFYGKGVQSYFDAVDFLVQR